MVLRDVIFVFTFSSTPWENYLLSTVKMHYNKQNMQVSKNSIQSIFIKGQTATVLLSFLATKNLI